ncbi:MAG TPA: DUF192 domain-containing protein [Patescibacteria group bacterium]|nr:DUF192 domain-containing protein [Patescibacteria group bacterium]
MKKVILVYIVLIIVVVLLVVVRNGGNLLSFLPKGASNATATVNGKTIHLFLAKSEKDREKGLSGRKSLDTNQGMLFIFDKKDKPGFWMRDMLFPLDIIYLDDNTVVYIVKNAPASTGQTDNLTIYYPDQPANYVLELNAGKTDELGISKGTKIDFKGIK